jgi:Spy/CpxP family protein refolding chaperone
MEAAMKRTLTTRLQIGLLTAASVAIAATAFAQGGPGPARGYGPGYGAGPCAEGGYGPGMMGGGMRGGMWGGGVQQARLDAAKGALNLTDAQQSAWNKYAETVKSQVEARQKLHEKMFNAAPEERAALHDTMYSFNVESAKAIAAARDELYTALTPEQKATADRYLNAPRYAYRGGPRF